MPYITVPYTFVNGAVADADQVNGNFGAITNGLQDGTKDISVNDIACSNVAASVNLTAAKMAITGTLTVSGMVEGSRHLVVWGEEVNGNTSGYLRGSYISVPAATAQQRVVQGRSGSLIGISIGRNIAVLANTQTVTPQIFKNGVAWISATTITVDSSGIKTGIVSSFARGANTFTEGDVLDAYIVTSGTAGSAAMRAYVTITAEVVYDS